MSRSSDCRAAAAISRRGLLSGGATLALWSLLPRAAIAGTRDPRLLVVVLRGGLDGLALAAPIGDPAYASLRGRLAIPASGEGAGLPLDGFFALNGAMPTLHALYRKKQALLLHAVASPYRGRSHFDGQDVLESGLGEVGRVDDGWLNRALGGLTAADSAALKAADSAATKAADSAAPKAADSAATKAADSAATKAAGSAALKAAGSAAPKAADSAAPKGLALAAVVPLVMRGSAPVLTWTPPAYRLPLRTDTIDRLTDLYAATDPALLKAFAAGLEIDRMADSTAPAKDGAAAAKAAGGQPFREFTAAAEAAARFFTTPGGPRIGALSVDGWDTHANAGPIKGLLANRLAGLDAALAAFQGGMGDAWRDTVVVFVTEFGRTASANGTDGTDHGTATTAILAGGAVAGGRVVADWPGLSAAALFEGRDLAPTRDLRSVFKGLLRDHLGIPGGALASRVFPDSAGIKPLDGLIT